MNELRDLGADFERPAGKADIGDSAVLRIAHCVEALVLQKHNDSGEVVSQLQTEAGERNVHPLCNRLPYFTRDYLCLRNVAAADGNRQIRLQPPQRPRCLRADYSRAANDKGGF
jgi:hypothetical protein